MTTWTEIVLRYAAAGPDMAETCRLWLEETDDREQAVRDFADQLRQDLHGHLTIEVDERDYYAGEQRLQNAVIEEALKRVQFEVVTRQLLDTYCPAGKAGVA